MSAGEQNLKSSLKVVIVGTGHGVRVHLPALRSAGFEVVALVGTNLERTERRALANGVEGAFVNLDEALDATGAGAVVVSSTPPSHADLVLKAIARNCHVLCEKPFAMNVDEARMMVAAAQKAGIVHMIGNQMRMMPDRAIVARAIADGLIGEPRLLAVSQFAGLVANLETKWPTWWFDSSAGGGWLGASGSHLIDMIRSWLGDFASVSAATQVVADRDDVAEDTYMLRFTMKNGLQGIVCQTGGAWGPFTSMLRLAGSKGTIWLEDGKAWLADRHGTRQLLWPDEFVLEEMAPDTDPRKQYLHVELPSAKRLCQAWRAAIRGEPFVGAVYATFTDGLAAMEVMDAIRASARQAGALIEVG